MFSCVHFLEPQNLFQDWKKNSFKKCFKVKIDVIHTFTEHLLCTNTVLSSFLAYSYRTLKITGLKIHHILQICAMIVTLSNNTLYAMVIPGKNLSFSLSFLLVISPLLNILIPLENCGFKTAS